MKILLSISNLLYQIFNGNNLRFTLHKKWRFSSRISSVNMTKSAGNCGFGHIYWRNPECKISFFVHCYFSVMPFFRGALYLFSYANSSIMLTEFQFFGELIISPYSRWGLMKALYIIISAVHCKIFCNLLWSPIVVLVLLSVKYNS